MSMVLDRTAVKVCSMSVANSSPPDDNVYRVSIDNTTKRVEVLCIGMDSVDSEAEGIYSSVDELPQWVQERIALLMMTDPTPPTKEVEGVGRRIDKYTFWICAKKGWELNYCVACYDHTDYSWTLDSHGYPDGEEFGKDHNNKPLVKVRKRRIIKNFLTDVSAALT